LVTTFRDAKTNSSRVDNLKAREKVQHIEEKQVNNAHHPNVLEVPWFNHPGY